jgi:NAD(P)-dependent dehydrogenase (short-subunit alcohol dehydrogenase family)
MTRAYATCLAAHSAGRNYSLRSMRLARAEWAGMVANDLASERPHSMPASLSDNPPTIMVVGASRGLGHAMAAEFLKKGWKIVGTVRGGGTRTLLHDLADEFAGRVEIEVLDICEPDQLAALRDRLSGRVFDMLFVNAGTTNNETETIGEVTTDEFVRVMVTNALSQHQQQRNRNAGGLSRQQGGAEHVHAKLCGTSRRAIPRDGADGSGLGAHRLGRAGRPADHRGERAEPGERPAFEAGHSGLALCRLSRPYGPVVIRRPQTGQRRLQCASALHLRARHTEGFIGTSGGAMLERIAPYDLYLGRTVPW